MRNRIWILGILLIGYSSSDLMAQDSKGWKIMGQTVVSEGTQRTQIAVNAKKGAVGRVKVQVKKAPVEIERMVLHFDKGGKQVVVLGDYEEGSWSRPIKVKGGKRVIKRAVFWYSQTDAIKKKPVVFLWGRR